MTPPLTLTCRVKFTAGRAGGCAAMEPVLADAQPVPVGRLPRVTRLMALAIRLDGLIRAGQISDQASVARLGRVTRARITQIMNLLLLAPDIQEQLLFLPPVGRGRAPVLVRDLQPIAVEPNWSCQRKLWKALYTSPPTK